MKNFTTKEIDYTGCNKDIAEFLKNNGGKELIKCYVWDSEGKNIRSFDWVATYVESVDFPYMTEEGVGYLNAEPMIKKSHVKSAVHIMQFLTDNNYQINKDGDWVPKNDFGFCFITDMWKYCGRAFDKSIPFDWHDDWLELV